MKPRSSKLGLFFSRNKIKTHNRQKYSTVFLLLFIIFYLLFLLLFFTVGKNVFFSVYLIDITLLDEYLRFHMITKRHCYLKKFIVILRDFSNHHVVGFFETNVPVFSVISTITVKS